MTGGHPPPDIPAARAWIPMSSDAPTLRTNQPRFGATSGPKRTGKKAKLYYGVLLRWTIVTVGRQHLRDEGQR